MTFWERVKAFLLGTSYAVPHDAETEWPGEREEPGSADPPILLLALVAGRVRVGHIETRQVKVKNGRKNETVEQLTFVEQDGPPWPVTDEVLDTARPWKGE